MVDQTTHPPKCQSFVGLNRQIGSSPPAVSNPLKQDATHTKGRLSAHIGGVGGSRGAGSDVR